MIDKYEIIYDYSDEYGDSTNIVEDFDGSWSELQEYLKRMRQNGCYNISATFLYSYNDVLY